MIKWTFLLICFIGGFFLQADAQAGLTLHLSQKTIGSKDAVQATYEFKNLSQPDVPTIDFKDWDVNGPSHSQGYSNINGAVSSSESYTFTLYPKHMGTLSVPGLQIDVSGKKISCAAQVVKVIKQEHVQNKAAAGDNSPLAGVLPNLPNMGFPSDIFGDGDDMAPPPISGVLVRPGQSFQEAAKNDFLIKINASKRAFYVGEPILVDYEFLGAYTCNWKPERFPSFNGFSVTDIDQGFMPFDLVIGGRRFRARTMRKAQLVALKTGRIPLDSASVSLETTFIDASNHADRRTGNILIKSEPSSVEVLPLPTENQPADFSGAIGHFTIAASLDKSKLPAGENNTLHIRISGNGNLDGVGLPTIKWPDLIQSYDAKDSQSVNKTTYPMDKTLEFEIPFIGSQAGGVVIPPIVFNYFDPDKKAYVRDSTDRLQVEFTAPLKDNGVSQALSQNHRTNRNYLWIIVGIAFILIVILMIVELKKRRKTKDIVDQMIPMSATDAQRPVPAVDMDAVRGTSSPLASGITEKIKEDQVRYLPPKLAQKIQEEARRMQRSNDNPTQGAENPAGSDQQIPGQPAKSRRELLDESLVELEEKTDHKEFFQLAKAFMIQYLQDELHSKETDEKLLTDALTTKDPDKAAGFKKLISGCNKSIYMPFTTEDTLSKTRLAIWEDLKQLIQG